MFPRARRNVRVNFIYNDDEGDSENATAAVNGALASKLCADAGLEASQDELVLSLAPLHARPESRGALLSSLVLKVKVSDAVSGLVVPRKLHDDYPDIFSRALSSTSPESSEAPTHSICVLKPISLTAVYLAALSDDAEEHALELETFLCAPHAQVVRQAETLSFRVPDTRVNGYAEQRHRDLKYKVLACEPVMQGVVRTGVTRFFVARAPEGIDERLDLNGDSSLLDDDDSALPSPVSDASDAFEIDEHFLASSLVSPLIRRPPYTTYAASSSGESTDLSSEDENGQPKHQNLAAATVETLVPRSAPDAENNDEEERILYVSPLVLGRVGVFSGDWAIVGRERSTDFRLVRLLTRSNYDRISSQQQALHASPVLAANIQPDLPPLASPADSRVTLRATPFGSHTPPIPTARAVTIARVASPASTDRTLQPLFLRALRSFFAGRKRLVKKGDLVAVKIDRAHASLINPDGEDDSEVEDILSTVRSENATDVVWFKITNLEYDVLDLPDDAAGGSDSYVAATMGELGVWVDTDVTKMMQSGLEHSRVPDVRLDSGSLSRAPLQDNANGIKLTGILSACLRPVAWEYQLHVSVLLKGARGVGKSTCAAGVARSLGLHLYEVNCYDLLGESEAATEGTLRARFERAAECAPCVLLLRHLEALARNSQVLETGRDPLVVAALRSCIDDLRAAWRTSEFPVFVLGTTSDADKLPPSLLGCFKHEIVFQAPAEADRLAILQGLLAGRSIAPEVDIPSLATQTAALVAGDLVDLVSRAELAAVSRALKDSEESDVTEQDVLHAGIALTSDDFDRALGKARAAYSESIGAPRIPNVTWDDVGGLADVKSDILDTIQLPLEHPELFAEGLKKRSGILLYGPPGTGKTLLAKAVATSCSLNFFSVKGPELLNMYIGESEANVRRVFQRARDARPCVIFFDELDSVAPKRGIQGDSGGVMDRIVSQLLAELDGIAEGDGVGDVFVIGATNRPDLLDPALLRPGRFDRMLYLGISDTHNAQLRILQALTRKFKLHPDLDLGDIAERCPFNYTGADFYALCSDAMLKAMSRKAQEVDAKIAKINESPTGNHPHPMTPQYYLAELATPDEISVLVGKEDFEDALRELTPSVSQSELEHYATVQARFANETIGSKKKGKGRA